MSPLEPWRSNLAVGPKAFRGASLGLGDVYVVGTTVGTRAYLVACLADGTWTCSCKRDHEALRKAGQWCDPILAAKKIATNNAGWVGVQ